MEESASVPAEGTGSPATARPKRSRTGCMTCRNRRRKCDEGKPVCQNCISKGFDCRYAAPFQILGKHNFTPEVKTDVKYANVRFAGDDAEKHTPLVVNQPAVTSSKRHSHPPIQTQSPTSLDTPIVNSAVDNSNRGISGHTPSPNSYEFALHGLLALGSTPGTIERVNLPPAPPSVEDQTVSSYDFASNDVAELSLYNHDMQRRPGIHRTETRNQSSQSVSPLDHVTPGLSPSLQTFSERDKSSHVQTLSTCSRSSPTETVLVQTATSGHSLELLKFFRYQIAPWLDVCDTDQHFGVTLLTKSTRIPSLRASVLRLSAASSNLAWASDGSAIGRSSSCGNASDSVASDAALRTVVDVVDILADAVPNLTAFWRRKEENRTILLEEMLLELDFSGLNTCAYWLLVRLELSRALMADDNRISLPLLTEQPRRFGTSNSIALCAYDMVALCVDASMFAQGDDDRWLQQRYGLNRVEVWKTLIQSFAHWYMRRSQKFQPIIDLSSKDGVLTEDDYPTIVFTSGSALLANQLYHTGMLLLLQHKPRFAEKPSQNSPSMSTLWHAHRICGIAIQNDRPGWWDPCLVASLIVAGRTATHASQHEIITSTLKSVQRMTGWSIDVDVEQLRGEWQLADSW